MIYEPISSLFVGAGLFILLIALAIGISNWFSQGSRVSKKYNIFEMTLLNELAKKKGFDLNIEEVREAITSEKSFKKKIQEELLKEFVEKQNKESNE